MKLFVCLMFTLALITGCSSGDDPATTGGTGGVDVNNVEPPAPKTTDPEPTPPEPTTDPVVSDKFHHYNAQAWHGTGSAIVLCPGAPRMQSCSIEGKPMTQHGSLDKGRYVWTIYGKSGLSGTITCKDGSNSYAYEVSGRGVQYGNCN